MINGFEINVWIDAQLSIHETVLKLNAKGLEVRVINTIDMVNRRKTLYNIKPYTPGKPLWEVQVELGLRRGIKLALNEYPLAPLLKALDAIKNVLNEINRYPDAHATKLKSVIASR